MNHFNLNFNTLSIIDFFTLIVILKKCCIKIVFILVTGFFGTR